MTKATRNSAGIILASAPFYAARLAKTYVGSTYDDAKYVLIAKSFLAGHYAALDLPGNPALNLHFPGFSLLLAPFVFLVQPHWYWLELIPLVLTITNGILLWTWLDRRVSGANQALIVGLYALNMVTVSSSSTLMAEPLFLFTVLLIFGLLFRGAVTPKRDYLCGALLAYSIGLRPEGVSLLVSLSLGFFWEKRFDRMKRVLGPCLLVIGAGALLSFLTTKTWPGYFIYWMKNSSFSSGLGPFVGNLLSHWKRLWLDLFPGSFLALPKPASFSAYMFGISGGLAVCVIIAAGIRRFLLQSKKSAESIAVFSYCAVFFLMHAFWISIDPRFYLPLMPFLLFFFVNGLQEASRPWRAPVRVLGVLLFAAYIGADARTALRPLSGREKIPMATFEWVRTHVPQAIFAAEGAPTLFLYTGKQALPPMDYENSDREAFRYHLLSDGIDYLYYRPSNAVYLNFPSMQDAVRQWQVSERWVKSWADAFEVVYENKAEETVVVRVKKDDRFSKSYALYLEAMSRLKLNQPDKARNLLLKARAAEPDLLAALNAEGMMAWRFDHDENAAIRWFQQALRIRPDYPLAWLNLGRLYQAQGLSMKSLDCYNRAGSAIDSSGEYTYLLDQMRQEMKL